MTARLSPDRASLPDRLPTLSWFSANCLSSFRPPAVCLSPDCPSTFRLSFYPLTGCHRFISRLRVCLSIPQSIHSCFSQHPLTVPRRFDRRLPVYPPTVHLSVCPSTYPLLFFRQLSDIVSTTSCLSVCLSVLSCFFSTSTDCPSPFRSPTARLSVRPSACPLLFFSTSTIYPSPSQLASSRGQQSVLHRML